MEDENEFFYLRLRGLPWVSNIDDIRNFLQGVNICNDENSIIIAINEDGKRTGDALIKLPTSIDLENALKYHRKFMGRRYIEVLKSSKPEFDTHLKNITPCDCDKVVRLRGLPYSCAENDIREFFNGLEIVPQGLVIIRDKEGRCSGEAYVEFFSPIEVREALQRHRQKIGNRYIEIFRCNRSEMEYLSSVKATPLMSINCKPKNYTMAPSRKFRTDSDNEYPYETHHHHHSSEFNDRGYHLDDPRCLRDHPSFEKFIHMRGLPYDIRKEEIEEFFIPLIPIFISFFYTPDDRFNGECDIYFEYEEDVLQALRHNNKRIGHRCVEVLLGKRRAIKTMRQNVPYSHRTPEKHIRYSPPRQYLESKSSFIPSYPFPSQPPMMPSVPNVQLYHDNPYISQHELQQNQIKVISYPDETNSFSQQVNMPHSQDSFAKSSDYFPGSKIIPALNSANTSEPNPLFPSQPCVNHENYTLQNTDKFYNFY